MVFNIYVVVVFDDVCNYVFFFFKQKTAYEMRISDWSSDVCSSDLFDMEANVTPPARTGRSGSYSRSAASVAAASAASMRTTERATKRDSSSIDRKSVVKGKSVSVSVALGGRRIIKKKKQN